MCEVHVVRWSEIRALTQDELSSLFWCATLAGCWWTQPPPVHGCVESTDSGADPVQWHPLPPWEVRAWGGQLYWAWYRVGQVAGSLASLLSMSDRCWSLTLSALLHGEKKGDATSVAADPETPSPQLCREVGCSGYWRPWWPACGYGVLYAGERGAMPESTGRNAVGVGRRHPVISLMVSFRAVSSFLAWELLHHAGEAYSTALYTRARALVTKSGSTGTPLWACETAKEVVSWGHFCSYGLEMLLVGQLSIQLHSKVGWCGIIRERCAIEGDSELTISLLGIQVEGCCGCLGHAKLKSPGPEIFRD